MKNQRDEVVSNQLRSNPDAAGRSAADDTVQTA